MQEETRKKISRIRLLFEIITIVILLFVLVRVYQNNNFNDYIRAEENAGVSKFSRDGDVRYVSNEFSYKIENPEYTDAMFYKKIKVNPNTPYKVTCMVKTKGVKNKIINADAGAHISINGTMEKSDNVIGDSDWTKLEFLFNSKNRESVEIGFRLGGIESDSIGEAWFTNIKIEAGVPDIDNNWKILCLIFNNTNVNIDNGNVKQNVKLTLSYNDSYEIISSFRRFETSLGELSYGKIKASCDVIEVEEPIQSMSYSDENGYFVAPYDIKDILDIFVSFKTGDMNKNIEIPINDWIGLGSMEYRNIGFSNIRIPSDEDNYIYKYDPRINTFPEEVFLHEFLHTLERNSKEYGYSRPELHDNEKYGYKLKSLVGLKDWYADYMNSNIRTSNGYIGLPEEIFDKKPVKYSDFDYSHKLAYFDEPQNLVEEIRAFTYKITNTVQVLFNRDNKEG